MAVDGSDDEEHPGEDDGDMDDDDDDDDDEAEDDDDFRGGLMYTVMLDLNVVRKDTKKRSALGTRVAVAVVPWRACPVLHDWIHVASCLPASAVRRQ